MMDKALEAARDGREAALADLVEELKIPSISTEPQHRDDCLENANWLAKRFKSLGFEPQIIDVIPTGNPVLRADWMGRSGAPTLTIYGHYDVQPPDPLDEWETAPFEPTVRDGYVYARGSGDNKGNHMAALKAVEFWMKAGGPPLNIRFLMEGEEEISGESLPTYLRKTSSEVPSDFVLVWDGGFSQDDNPSLMVGLRGLAFIEVEVTGPSHDVHSGVFGGAVANPAIELARIVAGLKDDKDRVTVPGFYDDVVDADPEERSRWHQPDDLEALIKEATGVAEVTGEADYGLQERMWTRPTLDVNGIFGGFTGKGQKTIIPARASAKISTRLVPNQNAEKIAEALETHIRALARPGVTIKIQRHSTSSPIVLGTEHDAARAAMRAFQEAFGQPAVIARSGGSIPVANAFRESLDAQMVISGIVQANSGPHSPNEKLLVENFHRGIEMLIRFMGYLGGQGG